jgi:LacI family transcriptional regulator
MNPRARVGSSAMARKTPVTLEEIANILNLSKATVSNALTGNRHVSAETVHRVREACSKYGYRANSLARGLRTKKTNVIGVTVPDVTEPFYSILVRHVEEELKALGYRILLGSYYFDVQEEQRIVETYQDLMVDGLIAIAGLSETDEVYETLADQLPIVFLDRKAELEEVSSVVADHKQIGVDCVDYLVSKGHKRIVHLTIPFGDFRTAELRAEGFKEALRNSGLQAQEPSIIVEPSIRLNEIPTSIAMAERISHTGASAVFAVSDYVAVGLLKGFSTVGMRVPEDISILSVTNTDYCLVTSPTLTSVDLSPAQSARVAVELMVARLSGGDEEAKSVVVPHHIVERESVKDIG